METSCWGLGGGVRCPPPLRGLLALAELGRGRIHLGGCSITYSGSFFLQ